MFRDEGGTTETRLTAVGRHLGQLAHLGTDDLFALLALHHVQLQSGQIATLERRLREAREMPPFWAQAVRAYLAHIQAALTRPSFGVPEDLLGDGRDDDAARRAAHDLLRRFAELVVAWPALWAAAQRLRARGVTLAR